MSTYATTASYDSTVDHPSDMLVLLALADQANDEGVCWPAVSSVARRARLSPRAVQKILARLAAAGHITITNRLGGRAGKTSTSTYRVHPIACPQRAAEKEARLARQAAGNAPATPPTDEPELPLLSDPSSEKKTGEPRSPVPPPRVNGRADTGEPACIDGCPPVHPNHQRIIREPSERAAPAGAPAHTHTREAFIPQIPEHYPPDLRIALSEWLASKAERRQRYTERGWRVFLASRVDRFPAAAVIAAIEECLSRTEPWEGIFPARHAAALVHSGPSDFPKKKESAPPDVQAAVLAHMRQRFPDFRGRFEDIPIAERRRALAEISHHNTATTAA